MQTTNPQSLADIVRWANFAAHDVANSIDHLWSGSTDASRPHAIEPPPALEIYSNAVGGTPIKITVAVHIETPDRNSPNGYAAVAQIIDANGNVLSTKWSVR
jgi:hypothetical protein